MKFKKSLIIICIFIFLFSVASAYANDINSTEIISNENEIDETITVENQEIDNTEENEMTTPENQVNEVIVADENEENTHIENYTTLNNDISNTNEGETLILKNNYQYDLNNDQKTITISKSITIDGNGHYIDGNNANAFLTINANDVILKNIIFKNAKTEDSSII